MSAGVFFVLVLTTSSTAIAANGIESIGLSPQALARGGADVAVGDSAFSQIDNPATLTLSPADAWRLDIGGGVIITDVQWSGLIDSSESQVGPRPAVNIALARSINDKLAWGIAFHSKSGLATRYDMRQLSAPFLGRRVGADMKNVDLSFNLGYRVTEKLSVGAGVRAELVSIKFSSVFGPSFAELSRGYAYGGGFQLGLHYKSTPTLAFGLGYRSPSWFCDMSGGDLKIAQTGLIPLNFGKANLDEFRLPQKIMAGVAWDATDWLKLVGEVRWINHANSSLDSVTVATTSPLDLRIPIKVGYKNQWVLAVGAEFKLAEHWKLGVGYNYSTKLITSSQVLPIVAAIAQHHITTGLRYEWDNWWVGGGYVLALPNSIKGRPDTPLPLGIDYAFSTIDQTQHNIFFGFGLAWQ